MSPQPGDMWEWSEDDWQAIVILVKLRGDYEDNWDTLCIYSTISHEIGQSLIMGMSGEYAYGWRQLA